MKPLRNSANENKKARNAGLVRKQNARPSNALLRWKLRVRIPGTPLAVGSHLPVGVGVTVPLRREEIRIPPHLLSTVPALHPRVPQPNAGG